LGARRANLPNEILNRSRALAVRALTLWRNRGGFAEKIADRVLAESGASAPDRAFALELFYGVLRNLTLLDFWIAQLRAGSVEKQARDLLRLGLFQVLLLDTPPHAAVFETVKLARQHTRGLINAILRGALRERSRLTYLAKSQPPHVRWSEPQFLVENWSRRFGVEETLELCKWNNEPAPIYARINRLKTSAAAFLERYPSTQLLPESENFVALSNLAPAATSGDCYVQDPSTAIACELLRPKPAESVLDACAAPGGKTSYLAELMSNQGLLIAADRDEARLDRLRGNLRRLEVTNVRALVCDWTDENSVRATGLPERSFDKILIDAPCTNTGVMRRRIDVRWRLRPDDLVRMPRQQLAILRSVARFLKPGGSLVYSSCSLESEENKELVQKFLENTPDFSLTSQEESLPFRDRKDGAFAARLESSP
jgi:16S rRNA (cytosine967-C5)-methyltransferase